MPQIPLPKGFSGTEDLPRTLKILKNCYINSEGFLVFRPGLGELNTVPDSFARAAFEWNDAVYMVFSNNLIKITDIETGAFSIIGTIAGSAVIETAIGFNTAVLVVKSSTGSIYTLDKSDVLIEIWDGVLQTGNAFFASCRDVTHIDSRFIYVPFDGSPVFFSDVGNAGSVQVESFFDAEVLPDRNNGCFALGNTLYITGTDSIELFNGVAGANPPFLRVTGGGIDVGFIGGLVEYDETVIFIGRKKNQGPGIFIVGPGLSKKISNSAIDLILSTYTDGELAETIPGRFEWRGDDIATLALRRDYFAFLKSQWFIFESIVDDIPGPLGTGFIVEFNNEYFTAFEDKIGKLEKVNKDYGERIERVIQFGIEQEDNQFFPVQALDLGISQGFNKVEGSISLQLSRDNVRFGDPLSRSLSAVGEYDKIIRWNEPGGLGTYEGFMALKFLTSEDIDFAIKYLRIDAKGKLKLA